MDELQKVDVTTENSQEEVKVDVKVAEDSESKESEKMVAQSDVNNIVAKERKQAVEKALKDLGIDDFDNAKDGIQKMKQWQESQKTEQEKLQDDLKKYRKESEEISIQNQRLNATISALKNGVDGDSVDDVITLASVMTSEDVSIDDAILKVLEKYPHFSTARQEESKRPKIVKAGNIKSETKSDVWSDLREKYKK